MYLYLRKYESCCPWQDNFDVKKIDFYPQELNIFSIKDIGGFYTKTTEYKIGYWRKANAIHKWFIDHCAKGVDECQEIYVSREKIKELKDLVIEILDDHNKANELLPTEDGFFFGSTDYDEWYFKDLEYTKDLLDKVIFVVDKYDFDYDIIYQASW